MTCLGDIIRGPPRNGQANSQGRKTRGREDPVCWDSLQSGRLRVKSRHCPFLATGPETRY